MKVFGITGYSGAGKTTLIEKLIPLVQAGGLSVSLIKHAHHEFDIDKPGKDSYRMREAGAVEVLLAGGARWVLMHELRGDQEPELAAQLARMTPVDLVLVEGYRRAPIPKLEVWRGAAGQPPRYASDDTIVGVAIDGLAPEGCTLPLLPLSQPEDIAAFVLQHASPVSALRF
jgi:molybdopterin-guanine dinucleotide biosynthesis adapter protein